MKKKIGYNYLLTLVLVFLFIGEKSYSQSSGFSVIQSQFDDYRNKVLQEKLYVHTDKNFYLAGELLWFKIYNVDASFHQPLDISKVAYVEILDKDHTPVLQTKLSLDKGTGNGSLSLPIDINSGNYIFRAYTNWMKNFDAEFFFEKSITIVNTLKSESVNADKTAPGEKYDVQFFPEGGNLVNGIESTVGFKAVDQYGKGIDLNGAIVDENNDTITPFTSLKFGIGSFQFLPRSGKTYKAVISLNSGNVITQNLPQVYNEGYVLHIIKTQNEKILARVQASPGLNGQNVFLFIHTRQQMIEASSASINNNAAEFLIDELKLGDGISQFTLFNNARQPLCERLYFKRPLEQLAIDANSDQQQYESRKKVNITISTKDESGNQLASDMSIAVYRLDSAFLPQQNIFNYLWLSSDLRGNIESPDYYFTHTDTDADKALDNLMVTQGWRRFKWKDVLQKSDYSFSFVPEYEGHIVSGTVHNKENNQPAKDVQSYFVVPGTNFQFYNGQTDGNGNVNFYTKNFFGPQEVFAQAGGRERGFQIDIKSPFSENYSSRSFPKFSLGSTSGYMLQANSVNMQVQNIYAADARNKFLSPPIDTSLFYVPTRTYRLDDYVRFPTMEEVLREYVQEIAVSKQNNKLILAAGRKDAEGITYRYEPLVLLDGVPLFDDPNKIFGYDPLKVKELQLVNKKYFFGTSTFEGIASFRTYKGRPEGLVVDANATVLDYEGLQLQREFYSPVYGAPNQISTRMPDFRNVLFWSSNIKTTSSGKQQLSFYTSDAAGKYAVVIEGLSSNGRAGSRTFTIDVINPLFVQK